MPFVGESDSRSSNSSSNGVQPRTLVVDNYDSYTFNLLQLLLQQNQQQRTEASNVVTIRNDQYPWPTVRNEILPHIDNIVISPGPGTPGRAGDFGICDDLIRHAAESGIPLLGVCLGHQGIARVYGARIEQCAVPVHGQTTQVEHSSSGEEGQCIFAGVPSAFTAVRYHSLAVSDAGFPHNQLQVLARATGTVATMRSEGRIEQTGTSEIMAIRHRRLPIFGVQFHPESIASDHGARILANFTAITQAAIAKRPLFAAVTKGIPRSVAEMSIISGTHPTDRCANYSNTDRPYSLVTAAVELHDVAETDDRSEVDGIGRQLQQHLYGDDPMPIWLDSAKRGDAHSCQSVLASAASAQGATVRYSLQTKQVTVLRFFAEQSPGHPEVLATHAVDTTFWEWMQQTVDSTRVAEPPVPGFRCGWIGYFAYEMKTESAAGGGLAHRDRGRTDCRMALPDAQLSFVDRCVVVDHAHSPPKAHVFAVVSKEEAGQPSASNKDSRWIDTLGCASKEEADKWVGETVERIEKWREMAATSNRNHRQAEETDTETRMAAANTLTVPLQPALPRKEYIAAIGRAKEYISQGETYEMCLTNQFRIALPSRAHIRSARDALRLYTAMRTANPAPYGALLWYPDICAGVASCSPERFLRIAAEAEADADTGGTYGKSRRRVVEMKPIKGTARRPAWPLPGNSTGNMEEWRALDAQCARTLRESIKERAENLMSVDLIRHDLNAITGGRVRVPRLMGIESYKHVHQMVTTVEARLSAGGVGDVATLAQCFPPGSMTGAPKIRTMRLLEDDLENSAPRGVYSGCLGYFSANSGHADWSVVIRTAVIDSPDELSVGAGGALTILSNPDDEWAEVETKLCSVLPAIQQHVHSSLE
ncbi:para-aminobenzoate synthase, (PABA) [Coemansia sp. RSA 1939]|nr:para-aminobenzoate synthase, (PABA) [Coemansia sp. RSA 1939]KAJ2617236.1 para-aminobenzoate synthase, (PABA) [Coemansia sp. RSA 1804]KAJ2688640.1 para-aminobenzoate synthase, (PABA) [Coemansia sp. RSA 1285]